MLCFSVSFLISCVGVWCSFLLTVVAVYPVSGGLYYVLLSTDVVYIARVVARRWVVHLFW
jgi:hypothetical protein